MHDVSISEVPNVAAGAIDYSSSSSESSSPATSMFCFSNVSINALSSASSVSETTFGWTVSGFFGCFRHAAGVKHEKKTRTRRH